MNSKGFRNALRLSYWYAPVDIGEGALDYPNFNVEWFIQLRTNLWTRGEYVFNGMLSQAICDELIRRGEL